MADKKMGRPPKLELGDETLGQLEAHAARGLTQEQIAAAMGMGESTFYRYKSDFPEFEEAIKRGQARGIAKVSNALFERATGISTHKETKTHYYQGKIVTVEVEKHYPPDVTAAIFYLKNRAPDEWKDRVPEGLGAELPTPVRVTFGLIPGADEEAPQEEAADGS